MFLKMYFYNNNKDDILTLLNNINKKENLNLSEYSLSILIEYYETDIRSMINHLQTMQNSKNYNLDIVNEDIYNEYTKIVSCLKNNININKINVVSNKLKKFLYKNNIIFDTIYLMIMDEIKNEKLTNELIYNMKILYYDSFSSFEEKIDFFLYNIIVPFYEIKLN